MSTLAAATKRKAEEAAPAPIEGYAFTLNGFAMEEEPGRKTHQEIVAYAKTGYTMTSLWNQLQADKSLLDKTFKPSIKFTPEEMGPVEVGTVKYLIIGYVGRELPHNFDKSVTAKQTAVGTALPKKAAHLLPWNDEQPPALAVVAITKEQPSQLQIFALVKPYKGLCQPYVVKSENVYYFSEFRTSETVKRKTAPAWAETIYKICVQPGIGTARTEKQDKFARAKYVTKLVFNPNIDFGNYIKLNVASFRKTNDPLYLDDTLRLLKELEEDVNYGEFADRQHLRGFIEDEDVMEEDEMKNVLKEYQDAWPNVRFVTLERLFIIKKGLLAGEIELEHRLLRSVVEEMCYELEEEEVEESAYGKVVLKIVRSVRRVTTATESAMPISEDQLKNLLTTFQQKLKEIMKACEENDAMFKASFGAIAYVNSLEDVWEAYGSSSTIDDARAAFFAAARVMWGHMRANDAGAHGMIKELSEHLERLNLGGGAAREGNN